MLAGSPNWQKYKKHSACLGEAATVRRKRAMDILLFAEMIRLLYAAKVGQSGVCGHLVLLMNCHRSLRISEAAGLRRGKLGLGGSRWACAGSRASFLASSRSMATRCAPFGAFSGSVLSQRPGSSILSLAGL